MMIVVPGGLPSAVIGSLPGRRKEHLDHFEVSKCPLSQPTKEDGEQTPLLWGIHCRPSSDTAFSPTGGSSPTVPKRRI